MVFQILYFYFISKPAESSCSIVSTFNLRKTSSCILASSYGQSNKNSVFKQRVVDHLQVGNRGLDLMRNVGDQLLQVSPFLCDAVFIFLHDLVQPPQPVVDFIEQAFFLDRLLRLHIPGEHIIHLTTKGIGEPDQLPADQGHKEDNAEQYKETEQEHTPDSGYILGQQINSGADCTNCQQQKRSQKDAGFVDGEFSHIHFGAPPIHI
mgnify:CR=1 FL=1